MREYKVIIFGAGPTGLTLAHALLRRGLSLSDVLVIEKESEEGGLCRSVEVDGAPLDIGGGHFLDTRRKRVLNFLFSFMPESEWQRYTRVAKINIEKTLVDHPLESNLWQLPLNKQINYLESISRAGCVLGSLEPRNFENWIRWKLGDEIADHYMLPYNRKIWSIDLSRLGTYWMYKLPDVSFREILLSTLQKKHCGKLPAHGEFYYPKKHGYGEVWRRMGAQLGNSLFLNTRIKHVDLKSLIVNGSWQAKMIFSTIPWHDWLLFAQPPRGIADAMRSLFYTSVDIDYHRGDLKTDAHWIYEPDEAVTHHRKLIRKNFIGDAKGFWTETNAVWSNQAHNFRHHNRYAYPVNTIEKPDNIRRILEWFASRSIHGAGRWGTWEHMNSDVAVDNAIDMVDNIYFKSGK